MRQIKWLSSAAIVCALASAEQGFASVNVFVDFNAAWVTELNQATSDAGVANFDSTERATIESNIFSQLQTIYTGYNVNFSLTDPGGTRDRIDFGVDESAAPAGTLGFAPLQIGNYHTGDDTNVLSRNFSFFIESGDARATQIAEISRGFSGTAAHELGHSLGLQHHQAYGDPNITPANYSNTGGLQNQYIMATGPTGLDEAGRESARTFNRWERAMFDITGGTVFGGDSIVNSNISTVSEGADIGATMGTAAALSFQAGESSGMDLALRYGALSSSSDQDWYRIDIVDGPKQLSAELFSMNLFGDAFDGQITLLDSLGGTVATNDDIRFSGNTFQVGGTVETTDSFLLNIPLNIGTYYLFVDPVSQASAGDDYQLLVGLAAVPEPASLAMLSLAGMAILARRRRA